MDDFLEEDNSSMVLRCIAISVSQISNDDAKTIKFSCFSASWVYSKVVLLGVSFLESEHRFMFKVGHLTVKPGQKTGYGEDGEQCGVEQLALHYYAGDDGGQCQGVHSESGIWLTVFRLLMWDAIFFDVPNVFLTGFQTSPLDLDTDYFNEARKTIIEQILSSCHQ